MCDTPSEYKRGDTVWVKLGNCWWPGETIDLDQLEESIKEDLQVTSRGRLPFAVVKFFQEDSYEYVKKKDTIFPYNCSKKDDFIKKGMDMHRAKKSNMEKFPEDVIIAEQRTNGDEKILDDPKFAAKKKEFSISEIFGTPKPKTPSGRGPGRTKNTPNSSANKRTPARYVTHPRFIGKRNDHRRIILVQTKKEEVKMLTFRCTFCGLASRRVDALALHMKTHIKTDPLFNDVRKKGKKRGPKTNKIPSSKTNSIDEDLALLEKGLSLSGGEVSESGEVPEKKKRRKRKRAPAPEAQDAPDTATSVKKPTPNITNDLLAEWDDGDDEDDDDKSVGSDAEINDASLLDAPEESPPKVALKVKAPVKQSQSSKIAKERAKLGLDGGKEQENGATSTAEKLDMDFSALLEAAKVPTLPSLPKAKTDEVQIGAKSPEIATKLTNPKKRFVKSFEDFELSMKERQQELAKEVDERYKEQEMSTPPIMAMDEFMFDDMAKVQEAENVEKAKSTPERAEEASEQKKAAEDKKLTRRSTRFDRERMPGAEKDVGVSEVAESRSEGMHGGRKSTRWSSPRGDKDKLEEKGESDKVPEALSVPTAAPSTGTAEEAADDKKVTRRSSPRAENDKAPDGEEKKAGRRGSARAERIEDTVESRKSSRRGDEKKPPTRKDDARTESESDSEKRDKSLVKKSKDEQKSLKDATPSKSELDKAKKENKPAKGDEKSSKKDEKASSAEESSKPAKKDADKAEKAEKKAESKEKPKPKEKILFEIDVFGSLRAQENEKYNKKAEDSPRRETRASRSKAHGESVDAPKAGSKRARRDEDSDDAQVNNGKSEESSSPLISKMKNKLMNKLSIEAAETPAKVTRARQKTPVRSVSTEEGAEVPDTKGSEESKDVVEEKERKAEARNDLKHKEQKPPESPRRQSLRNAPAEERKEDAEKKTPRAKEESKALAKTEESASVAGAAAASPKAEIKSPKLGRPTGGPKTYLRSSRAEKSDAPAVRSPLASPTRAAAKALAAEEKVEAALGVESAGAGPDASAELKEGGGAEKTSKVKSPRKSTDSDSDVSDWLKALSSPKKLVSPTREEAKRKEREASPAVEPAAVSAAVKEGKSAGSPPAKATTPAPSPKSPVRAQQSPAKTPPSSPARAAATSATPSSPIKTPLSSPLRQSPIKSPPIILNKDAPKFDASVQPKKASKRDEELAKAAATKSPRRVSLSSQEVCITEKVEAPAEEEVVEPAPTTPANVTAAAPAAAAGAGAAAVPTSPEPAAEVTADPLDLLASVSTLNKDGIEKNITVVPENILADGQVEIAKIIEDGTEKVASIPNVSVTEVPLEKAAEAAASAASGPAPAKEAPPPAQKPIILNSKLAQDQESTSKLLDILTDNKRAPRPAAAKPQQVPLPKIATPNFELGPKKLATGVAAALATATTAAAAAASPKQAARVVASALTPAPPSTSKAKPTILSDTLIRPADSVVSVQKVKRSYDDIEDIDAFIITKHPKKSALDEEVKKSAPASPTLVPVKSKPKILEHTIITAAGQVIQPISKIKKPIIQQQTIKVPTGSAKTVEEKVYDLLNSPKGKEEDAFDINNMPIMLGDQLLTSDAIPVMVDSKPAVQQIIRKQQQQIKPIPKQQQQQQQVVASALKTAPTTKTYTKVMKGGQRVYQTATTTSGAMVKHQPTILASGKQGKFVIVPSQSTAPPGTKYTVGKRPVVKKQPTILAQSKQGQSVSAAAEPSGNKIMIVTNHQGQQQRLLITPEQQKRIGYQSQVKKTIVKTTPAQKKIIGHAAPPPGSGLVAVKKSKIEAGKLAQQQQQQQQKVGQKFSFQGSLPPMKGVPGQTRTVIIKNQQGEIVNRIHGTSDEDIEKQVAEQLEAINRAANKTKGGAPVKRVIKKAVTAPSVSDATRSAIQSKAFGAASVAMGAVTPRSTVPPLAPISAAKKVGPDLAQVQAKQMMRQQKVAAPLGASRMATTTTTTVATKPEVAAKPSGDKKEERPPKQLVIQDAMGNETTIMEGQILALPSETVDGQPQSYMLVTLDETGSLTPLNNEALMSLDPNLNLGGDLSNMVLQIEGSGAGTETVDATTSTQAGAAATAELKSHAVAKAAEPPAPAPPPAPAEPQPEMAPHALPLEESPQTQAADAEVLTEQIHAITCSINKGDMQQNLIITGDPVATQKFLESLTEGNPEIANLLAQVDGQNILIHTDGQQILINQDVDSQMLMSLNSQLAGEGVEEPGQLFAAAAGAQQSSAKNQDILAAALADTDVFQQEQTIAGAKLTQSQLSPGYPMPLNNVLETSTVNSPIMTPLEVPSANSKIKAADVLAQVPKNVDLPITITDPSIAQSVANQQVNLLPAELAAGIELPLAIQDVPAASSAEMSSPTTFYSLPSLDDGEKFASPISMPLLTEDPEEAHSGATAAGAAEAAASGAPSTPDLSEAKGHDGTAEYLLATGDMCTMSNQISLSEPPPDMFDFPVEQAFAAGAASEQLPSQAESGNVAAASILRAVGKSPKRGLDGISSAAEEGVLEGSKRAKLD